MDSVKGKVVLITGASGGIGRATAVLFAKCGSSLALTGRDAAKLQETAELCSKQGLPKDKIFQVTGDLTNEEDVNRIVDAVTEKLGGIHTLVNNAGLGLPGAFETSPVSNMDANYNNNVRSVYMVTKRALPHIIQNKGTIINVSSLAADRPIDLYHNYSVVKAAINQFTKCLALELAPKGVRVNAVTPGAIKTDLFIKGGLVQEERLPQFYENQGKVHPMQRVGEPEEVAQTILYLASDMSSFTTGAIIPIDGGRHATCMQKSFAAQ